MINVHFLNYWCLSYFTVTVVDTMSRSSLRQGEFILAYGFREMRLHDCLAEAWWLQQEAECSHLEPQAQSGGTNYK